MSELDFVIFNQIDALIENQLFEDAYQLLYSITDKDDVNYSFYLAFLEAQLGQSEEAVKTLMQLSKENMSNDILAIFHGFAADILNNEGFSTDALEEISTALDLDPADEFIKKKYNEILEDFSGDIGKILFLIKLYLLTNLGKNI